MTLEQRRGLAAAALELIDCVQRHGEAPIFLPTPPERVESMLRPPPEGGTDPVALLANLQAAASGGWSKSHGGDLGYVPSGGIYSGALAALLAGGIHAFTGAAFESPALVALEESVLRWFAQLMGLPDDAQGLLLSGGSLANQTAIVCARSRAGEDRTLGTVYLSEHAHHSLDKALHLCGVPAASVRHVRADAQGRVDTTALRSQIELDQAAGLQPWLIVGVAGSTDTGSIDPLDELADIASACGAWLHIDAAYGGFFALTERGARALQGIGRADSITLDAHKGLQLSYGVGAVLVRSPGVLAQAHAGAGAYMRDVPQAAGLPHYFDLGPELTRPFRGLLVWLPLHLHGIARFRQALDQALNLAALAAQALGEMPGLQVLQPPQLSIIAFRCLHGDDATQALLEAINTSGRYRVSSTTIGGRIAIRLAFLHHRTGPRELQGVLDLIRSASSAWVD